MNDVRSMGGDQLPGPAKFVHISTGEAFPSAGADIRVALSKTPGRGGMTAGTQ